MSIESISQFKYNLLVVDDEPEVTKSLRRQFRKKYTVFTANTAKDALNIMEHNDIQVIISDQRMPEITGIDFFMMIKSKYPNALKLILTGYSDIEAVIGAINEGQVFRYITKPWHPKELEAIIQEAFEKYELITKNKRLMRSLQETNLSLEEKVKFRTKELEDANEKLRDLNIEKNKYIGIVAHDLRNPIGAAKSFSDLMLLDFDLYDKEEHDMFLQSINKQCSFALNLIEDFLDISKIEAGIFELKYAKHDYITFVKENITKEQTLFRKKSQKIFLHTEIDSLPFFFDKDKIEQVMDNLLSNASKYSPPKTNIDVSIVLKDNRVFTEITDHGQGIAREELDLLFKAYKTTSTKSTAQEKSTGLGLAIVKKIIDAHEGKISVESTFGEGSTFIFELPFRQKI